MQSINVGTCAREEAARHAVDGTAATDEQAWQHATHAVHPIGIKIAIIQSMLT